MPKLAAALNLEAMRAGGNPVYFQKLSRKNKTMDPRLRGGDEYLKIPISLKNVTLDEASA